MPFDNSYARELPGLYQDWPPAQVAAPRLLYLNRKLQAELGLDVADAAATWVGNALPEGARPIAQAYAGHQFGAFSPSLGDGRALLIGEVIDTQGRRRDIAFKGSGRTPFSRGGDGKAAVGPMLREVLIGEALQALGIPTTRALAVVATGEPVIREEELPGAVLTRVASSHLRVGTFEYFAARGDLENLRKLCDYAIARHDPELVGQDGRELAFLRKVAQRQAKLIAQWMGVGFIHGVMNTDNMAISGESIDFGPCAFMEAYDPATKFSSIDRHGRYALGNQPAIARWNLARLAEALLPLVAPEDDAAAIERAVAAATEVIDGFPVWYEAEWQAVLTRKLGIAQPDATLAADWLALLQQDRVDCTLAWRALGRAAGGDEAPLRALFESPIEAWLTRWKAALAPDAAVSMALINPRVIPRNHRVEDALKAAWHEDDLQPFEQLLDALRRPFDEDPELQRYADPAPAAQTACYKTFCGT